VPPGGESEGGLAAEVPPDLQARLRKFEELERDLRRQREELDAERDLWSARREELLAEFRARQEELAAARAPAGIEERGAELGRALQGVRDREVELARQQEEVNAARKEMGTIRQELSQRYQKRRDRILSQQQGVRRVARKLQQRKQRAEARDAALVAA